MSLWKKLKDRFAPATPAAPAAPVLRNRPGGLAWINATVDCGEGSIVLVNRVVRTTALMPGGIWVIEPHQVYALTKPAVFSSGMEYPAGAVIRAIALKDHCLTPMPGITADEQTEERGFQPPVPTGRELQRRLKEGG